MSKQPELPSFEELFGRAADSRHDVFDLRRVGDYLTGRMEAEFLGNVRRWAEQRNLNVAVEALHPEPTVATAQTLLRDAPSVHSVPVTEVLLGQSLDVLRSEGAWRLVRSRVDRYLGWVRDARIRHGEYRATHLVTAMRAHAHAVPRVQGESIARLSWGARVRVLTKHGDWYEVRLPDGRGAFVPAVACGALGEIETSEPLETWDRLLWTPYVWGGASSWGIDCSGYVQLLHRMAGRSLPRDTDEQAEAGARVERPEPGDLAIFPGHIGLMIDGDRIAHASGTAMRVTVDVLAETPHLSNQLDGFVRIDPRSTPAYSHSDTS